MGLDADEVICIRKAPVVVTVYEMNVTIVTPHPLVLSGEEC